MVTLRKEKQISGNLGEVQLITHLYKIIENKRNALKRVASSELVTLFWNLGNELNEFFKKKPKLQTNKNIIHSTSANLVKNYGSYLTIKNLVQIQQFADHYPNFSKLQEYIHFLSWEHILQLLKVKNHEARQFYLILKIEQGFSVKDLQNAIALEIYDQGLNTSIYENEKITRKKVAENFLQKSHLNPDMLNRNDRAKSNPFKKPFFSLFSPTAEPTSLSESSNINIDLHKAIYLHIEKFRDQQNRWLNANFNLLNWEIGRHLNQNISPNIEKNINGSIIQNISAQLQKHGKNFSVKQLKLMMKFAERFPSIELASPISYSMSWEQIISLMDIDDKNDFLNYIKAVNEIGLNANDQRKLNLNNSSKHNANAGHQKQPLLSKTQVPKEKIVSTKSRHSVINIRTIDFELSKVKMFNPNILENKYLQDFVVKR